MGSKEADLRSTVLTLGQRRSFEANVGSKEANLRSKEVIRG